MERNEIQQAPFASPPTDIGNAIERLENERAIRLGVEAELRRALARIAFLEAVNEADESTLH